VTDLDKLKSLLDEWEVPYEEDEDGLTLEANAWDNHAKVIGYSGFVTLVAFDENGGFSHVGIWE
jgi:hypothetical protein